MNLKKINPLLKQTLIDNGFLEPNELQQETFSTIKSGADAVIQSKKQSGKSMTIVVNTIQQIEKAIGESTRALILVKDKEKVLEMVEWFKKFTTLIDLRIIGCHDKGDIDFDKNEISAGMDIIVGTPTRINAMFTTAGFNLNTIKMFVVDDADELFRLRHDAIVLRLSMSLEKTQRIFFCSQITERIESLSEKIMIEPVYIEIED